MDRRLKDFDLYKTYLSWIDGTGPFRCFCRATNFVSLKHYPDFQIAESTFDVMGYTKLFLEISRHDVKDTLFIIDFPDEKTIDISFGLHKKFALMPILTFNNVLHPFGLVGSKQYISKLLLYGENMDSSKANGYFFVLDNSRYIDTDDGASCKYFNNQYELTEFDLPSSEMLRELGYAKVFYCYDGKIKEDTEEYLKYLSSENFEIIFNEFEEDL